MSAKKNILYSITSQMVMFIILMAFNLLASRILGPEAFGYYTLFLLIPFFLGRFGHLGLDAANAYFISDKTKEINLFWNSILLIIIVSGVLFFIVSIDFSYELNLFGIQSVFIFSLIPLTIFSMFRTLFQSLLIGKDRIALNSFISVFDATVPLIGLALLVFWGTLSANSLILVSLVGLFVTSFAIFYFVEKKGFFDTDFVLLKNSIRYGSKSWLNNLANQMLYKVDVFFIGYFLGLKSVGIYAVAVILIEKSWYLSGAIGNAIFPKLKKLDDKSSCTLAISAAKINYVLSILGVLVICIFAEPIMLLLFGAEYKDSSDVLFWLAPGIVALSIPKVLISHLAAKNKLGVAVKASTTSMVLNVVLNIILIPFYGLIGAAIASSISYGVYFIIYSFFYMRMFNVTFFDLLVPKLSDIRNILNAN